MAETLKLDNFAALLHAARSAFSDDPSYATAAAAQAHIVRARRTPTASPQPDEQRSSDRSYV